MKRLVSLVLSLILVPCIGIQSFALANENQMEISRNFQDGKEYVTVTITPITTRGINDFDVDDLLRNLGYSENSIEKMPINEKQKFLQTTNFNSEIAVIKTDSDGEQTFMTEEEGFSRN